jgi:hypothetical protein
VVAGDGHDPAREPADAVGQQAGLGGVAVLSQVAGEEQRLVAGQAAQGREGERGWRAGRTPTTARRPSTTREARDESASRRRETTTALPSIWMP